MRFFKILLLNLLILAVLFSCDKSTSEDIEQKISALVNKMTIEEKIAQMSQALYWQGEVSETAKGLARKGPGSFFGVTNVEIRNELQKVSSFHTAMQLAKLRLLWLLPTQV